MQSKHYSFQFYVENHLYQFIHVLYCSTHLIFSFSHLYIAGEWNSECKARIIVVSTAQTAMRQYYLDVVGLVTDAADFYACSVDFTENKPIMSG